MNRRLAAAVLVAPAALAMAACTSSSPSGKGTGTGTSASTGAPSSASKTIAASVLADKLQASLSKLSSAAFTLGFSIGTQSLTGAGAEKFDHGKLVALKVTETAGTASAELVVVGGKIYAKLPPAIGKTAKPWVLVSESSKNAVIKGLAPQVNSALASASLTNVNEFVRAAKSVQDQGPQRVNGVPATKYSVIVDVTKLPAPLQRSLGDSLSSLPLDIYLDSQDRPIVYVETATLAGQKESVRVTLTDFNKPLTITAPPASQVGTS